jgi:hypothetical protein
VKFERYKKKKLFGGHVTYSEEEIVLQL